MIMPRLSWPGLIQPYPLTQLDETNSIRARAISILIVVPGEANQGEWRRGGAGGFLPFSAQMGNGVLRRSI